jgi:hypothetical protein
VSHCVESSLFSAVVFFYWVWNGHSQARLSKTPLMVVVLHVAFSICRRSERTRWNEQTNEHYDTNVTYHLQLKRICAQREDISW